MKLDSLGYFAFNLINGLQASTCVFVYWPYFCEPLLAITLLNAPTSDKRKVWIDFF